MTYDVLATGSSGNAVVINNEILIDCGVPYKLLRQSGYIEELRLVLLNHQHGDHFNPSTVARLQRERPALRWGCCDWMVPHLLDAGVKTSKIDLKCPGVGLRYFGIGDAIPVPLVHDVPNCAWRIHFDNSEKLFYATDTGTLNGIKAEWYDYYLIEANQTEAEIALRIAEKKARGEFAYEVRAARNHLSYEQAMKWLSDNAGPNSRYELLHQHKRKTVTRCPTG